MVKGTGDKDSDTIAGIATPPGIGGIGIVRMSGPDALRIADSIFEGKKKPSELKGFQAIYGWITDGEQRLDEAIVLVMRGPRSYTREDVVELQCHGGPVVLRQILDAVLKKGARLAEPGEFTRRAFLSGRIDLSQAEAVASLVFSQTSGSARAALRGLSGELGKKIKGVREVLMKLVADLEAGLDFAEEDIEFVRREDVERELKDILLRISGLIRGARAGMILSEGVKLVIAGKPNAGKSTLMNALLERDRVIVTPYPGTTRDVVEEVINLDGVLVRLSDTAGIREDAGEIEKEGVARSWRAIQEADLILLMFDGSERISEYDRRLIEETKNLKRLILVNKIDLKIELNLRELEALSGSEVLEISAREGTGLDRLRKRIQEMIWEGDLSGEDALVSSARQLELLKRVKDGIEDALNAHKENLSEEFIVAELRKALNVLAEISGEIISDEILDMIFSRFCIGK